MYYLCTHVYLPLHFLGPGGLIIAKPSQYAELGALGASPSWGSHNIWCTTWVGMFLPGRSWRLGEIAEDIPTSSFRLLGGPESASVGRLIRSQNLK